MPSLETSPSGPNRTTTPKKRKKTAKAPVTRLSRYGDLDQIIVHNVVKPCIDRLIKDGVTSLNDLTEKFRKGFNSGVGIETVKEWLDELGYRFEKPKVQLVINQPTQGAQQGSSLHPPIQMGQSPINGAQFDEPTDPSISFDQDAQVPTGEQPPIMNVGGIQVARTAGGLAQMERLTGIAPDFAPPR